MKKYTLLSLTSLLLFFTYSSKAAICYWSGSNMGNWSDPANWSCGIVPGVSDTVQLTGQAVLLNDSTTIRALVLVQNCTIAGSGTLTVSGEINLNSGGDQTFLAKIISNGTLEAKMATLNFNARPFLVAGTANFTQCIFWMRNGGTFEIEQTGVATFQNSSNFFCFNSYFGFVVRGTIVKTGASNMDFESLYWFKNATVNIQSGSLINYFQQSPLNCIIDSSTINIAAGAFLRIERIVDISNSTIAGAGKIWIGTGQCHFIHPNSISVDVDQKGGSCTVTNGVDTLANYTLSGGSMSGGIQIKGSFDWIKGNTTSIAVKGFTTISDTTAAAINQKSLGGTLTLNGGGKYSGNDQLTGTINIPANTLFTLDANPSANFKADLQISGTLRKMNTDAVLVGFVINNGRIEGLGKIDGTVIASGTLAPGIGSGTGILSFNGPNLFFNAQSKLEIQVTNTGTAVSNDLLNLLGSCKLDGTLIVMESGDIPPGDYVVVQASGALTGAFSQLNLPPYWELIQNPLNITLRKLPAPPEAHFSVLNGSVCAPTLVEFADASMGSTLSYNWTFPGGNPAASTDKNPTVEYTSAGSYTATLTVTNTLGSSTFSADFNLFASTESTLQETICAGDSVYFDGQYLSLPGVYLKYLINAAGCDSLISFHLSTQTIELSVSQTDSNLTALASDAAFQWLDCSDFSSIPGATEAIFSPVNSGTYAVLVTQNGCSDTSACFLFTVVGVNSLSEKPGRYQVFPNPASDFIQITWNAEPGELGPDALLLFDMRGGQKARFTSLNWAHHTLQLDVSNLAQGPYFLVLEKAGLRYDGIPVLIGQ